MPEPLPKEIPLDHPIIEGEIPADHFTALEQRIERLCATTLEKQIPEGAAEPSSADGITDLYFALQRVLNWPVLDGSVARYCLPQWLLADVFEAMEQHSSSVDLAHYKKLLEEKGPMSGTW